MSTVTASEATAPILEWEVRLWHRDPAKRYAILAVACVAGAAGWLLFKHPLMAFVGFGAIFASTTDFWLPQRFKLDGNGASMRCGISVTSIQWDAVKRAISSEAGVQLSPLRKEGRMDAFRGVFLRFANNKEEVLSEIRRLAGIDITTGDTVNTKS